MSLTTSIWSKVQGHNVSDHPFFAEMQGVATIEDAAALLAAGKATALKIAEGSDVVDYIDKRGVAVPYPKNAVEIGKPPDNIRSWTHRGERILASESENVWAYFTHRTTDDTVRRRLRERRGGIPYADIDGSTTLFRNVIGACRNELVRIFKDKASMSLSIEGGTSTIDETLDRLMGMKCVWVGVYLLFCDSPLANRIRELMNIDTAGVPCGSSTVNIPLSIRKYCPLSSNRERDSRSESLIAYLEKKLSEKFGKDIRCTDALTIDKITHISFLMEIDIHVVDVDVYQAIERSMTKVGDEFHSVQDGGNIYRQVSRYIGGREPIYHSAHGSRSKKLHHNKYALSVVFKRSKEIYSEGHLEPEFCIDWAVKFARAAVNSGVLSSRDVYLRVGDDMVRRRRCDTDFGDTIDGLSRGHPLYVGNKKEYTSAGYKQETYIEITSPGQLRDFVERLCAFRNKAGVFPVELGYDIVYIGLQAYETLHEVLDRELMQSVGDEDVEVAFRLDTPKYVFDAIQCSPDIDGATCLTTKCKLDHFQSMITRRQNKMRQERIRLDRVQGRLYYGTEEYKQALMAFEEEEKFEDCDDKDNIRIVEGMSEFSISTFDRAVRVICRGKPSTIVTDAMVENHLNGVIKYPVISRQERLGHERKLKLEATLESEMRKRDPSERYIAILQERLSCIKDKEAWLKNDMKSIDPILDGMETEVVSKNAGTKRSFYKGCDIMDRYRVYDAPDVADGKIVNSSSWNQSFAANSTDGRDVGTKTKYEIDLKQAYPMAAQGAYNSAFPLDYNGAYPTHYVPNNPSLQPVDHPITSYISGMGTVNLNREDVNIRALAGFTKIHSSHGSLLKQYLATTNGPEVVSHTMLIAWTMDVYKEANPQYPTITVDFYKVAREFQLDILGIRSGRFALPYDVRMAVDRRLYGVHFDDFGTAFIENEHIYKDMKEVFSHALVVPNRHDIIIGMDSDTPRDDGEYRVSDNLDDMRINPRIHDRVKAETILSNSIRDTTLGMLICARNMWRLRQLIGIELKDGTVVSRADVKLVQNSSVGRGRQDKTHGYSITSSSSMMDKDAFENGGVYIEKLDPRQHVAASVLSQSGKCILEMVTVDVRQVRGAPEGFRDYAVTMASRAIEFAAMSCDIGSKALRIKVDSVLVEGETAMEKLADRFMRITNSECCEDRTVSSGLPGFTKMYSVETYTHQDCLENPKFYRMMKKEESHRLTNGIYEGIPSVQSPTSLYKKKLDNVEWVKVKASELLYTCFRGDPIYTSTFGDLSYDQVVDLFYADFPNDQEESVILSKLKDEFHKEEKNMIIQWGSCVMVGSPGTGKSYLAYQIARHYMDGDLLEEDGPKTVRLTAPFWRIAVASRGNVTDLTTMHSHVGGGVNSRLIKKNPLNCLMRKTEHYAGEAPYKTECALTIMDEVGATDSCFEEAIMCSKILGGKHIFVTDKCQSSAVTTPGIHPEGSIIKWAAEGKMYIKDLEYRNPHPDYRHARDLSRIGNAEMYFSPALVDFVYGDSALPALKGKLEEMANEWIETGECSTTLVVQNYNITGLMVATFARLVAISGKVQYDCILSHIGGGIESKTDEVVDDLEAGLDQEERDMYLGSTTRFSNNAHTQRVRGIPLMFVKGSKWMAIKSFKTHLTKLNALDVAPVTITQSTIISYVGCGVFPIKFTKPTRKGGKGTNDVYKRLHQEETALFLLFRMGDTEIYLTEYEAATYLFYPFMAQRISLIGLTLNKVVLVQVSVGYNTDTEKRWNRTYEPIRYQLDAIRKEYGEYSHVTELCRQLHVLVTRLKTGRTMIIDWEVKNVHYTNINYNAMTGATCLGFMAMFNEKDRDEFKNKGGFVYKYNQKVRRAIRLRGCKVAIKGVGRKYVWNVVDNKALLAFKVDAVTVPVRRKETFMDFLVMDKISSTSCSGFKRKL